MQGCFIYDYIFRKKISLLLYRIEKAGTLGSGLLNYTGLTVCDIGSEGALLNSIFMYMDDESMADG